VEITVRRERGVSQRVANTVITRKVTVWLGARCVAVCRGGSRHSDHATVLVDHG
jgi:hypothetical protein